MLHVLVTNSEEEFEVISNKDFRTKILVYDKEQKKFLEKYETKEYFGYEVFYYNKPLPSLLEKLRKRGFYLIGTSRLGEDVRRVKIKRVDKIAIAFGSFARGFEDMFGKKFKELFDITINVVPNQIIYSIRTEEAIFYTLAILRYMNEI